MAGLSDLQALYTAAVAAFDGGDYTEAIKQAAKARLLLGVTPGVTRSLGQWGAQSITFTGADSIDQFIKQCRQLQADVAAAEVASASAMHTSGVFRQTRIVYARPGASGLYA